MIHSSDPSHRRLKQWPCSSHQSSCLAPDDITNAPYQRRHPALERVQCSADIVIVQAAHWGFGHAILLCRSGTVLRRTGRGGGYETSGQDHRCKHSDLDERVNTAKITTHNERPYGTWNPAPLRNTNWNVTTIFHESGYREICRIKAGIQSSFIFPGGSNK